MMAAVVMARQLDLAIGLPVDRGRSGGCRAAAVVVVGIITGNRGHRLASSPTCADMVVSR
jgi:hypothetical protein